MRQPQGNGSGRVNIHQQDMGGWVRVFTDRQTEGAEDLPVYLSHSLSAWFRQRPHLYLRSVVPVSRDGNTVELHAWYGQHLFPDLSGQEPKPAG